MRKNSFRVILSDYLIDTINKGSLALMISIGTVLDFMISCLQCLHPSTVEEISKKANLNQRYVKEWLGTMVTVRIVDYDSSNSTFNLPKEKTQFLTQEDNLYNFSASMQWIPVLAQVEDKVVECFHCDGGAPFSSCNRFHEVMAEERLSNSGCRLNRSYTTISARVKWPLRRRH